MLCLKLDLRRKYMLPGCRLHTDCFNIILSGSILRSAPAWGGESHEREPVDIIPIFLHPSVESE